MVVLLPSQRKRISPTITVAQIVLAPIYGQQKRTNYKEKMNKTVFLLALVAIAICQTITYQNCALFSYTGVSAKFEWTIGATTINVKATLPGAATGWASVGIKSTVSPAMTNASIVIGLANNIVNEVQRSNNIFYNCSTTLLEMVFQD